MDKNLFGERNNINYLGAINRLSSLIKTLNEDTIKSINSFKIVINKINEKIIDMLKLIISLQGDVIDLESKLQ